MTVSHAQALKSSLPEINRIGRFHILKELGRGAIGVVYLAHDPIIDREVAIKTFLPKLPPGERRKHEEQFINEARAAGRLSHPSIITIFDASTEGGSTYIAMEYLKGRELSRLLARKHPFEASDVAVIIGKVAEALDYAHKNDVVHRDIKPSNIFLIGDNHPKIVDFGIARSPNRVADQFAQSNDAPYTLFHNNVLGTPNYMSPEQACGEPADPRSDIYSLGAVMYEMLAGKKPFESRDTEKLLKMIALQAPPAPHEVNSEVPEALSRIVMRAMSKRPEKRYQHAQEMALELKRFLAKHKRSLAQQTEATQGAEHDEAADAPRTGRKLLWLSIVVAIGAVAAYYGRHFLQ